MVKDLPFRCGPLLHLAYLSVVQDVQKGRSADRIPDIMIIDHDLVLHLPVPTPPNGELFPLTKVNSHPPLWKRMQSWKRQIPTIMTSEELLERAFSRGHKIEKEGTVPFDTAKKTDLAKISAIGDMTVTTLLKYVRAFPSLEKKEEFFPELIDVIVGQDELKRSLSALTWAAERCSQLQRKYTLVVRRAHNIDAVEIARREFYGRFASVIKQIDKDLKFVSRARDEFRKIPTIDPSILTVVVAGYPNVGKSQLVERISTAKPTIAAYPFTTKGIIVGHFADGWRNYQIIDTPGLLDRELEERNKIELQAILALKYLADMIVFLLDPSETCGYNMERQLHLLGSVMNNFGDIPFILVENKSDVIRTTSENLKISALTGEGVDVLTSTLAGKLKEIMKAEREVPPS